MPLRDAGLEDGPGLTAALFEAANWDGRARFTRDQLLADPHMSHYVADWPRATDFGTVAVDDHGEMIGAAWCRLFDTIDQGEPTAGRIAAGSSTQSVSWNVRLRRPCGDVRGAAGWASREQARDRRR
ncbi:MAG TPA: hypothetical protein VIM19_08875, partial [Actinomycetes bacterium]